MNIREIYIVKNARLAINNDDSIIIELNRGQKWVVVGKPNSVQVTIQRENVTITIPVSDFNDIFEFEEE